jgi:hypothetical protein
MCIFHKIMNHRMSANQLSHEFENGEPTFLQFPEEIFL